ncbi:hypothetical protein CJ204_00905 [Corynebacterium xerosis]|uniref:HTH cro/C1-type domain-containing protein n=2 Tax=Corynebacterium xerosis TaxID=1725 RepID=A0A2N6T270_9CORY|nr:hypothetical protein CJ204_00905 [Corynebacterium xerosis]
MAPSSMTRRSSAHDQHRPRRRHPRRRRPRRLRRPRVGPLRRHLAQSHHRHHPRRPQMDRTRGIPMTTNKDEQQLRTIVDNNLLRTIRKRRYEANKPQEWVRSQLRTLGVHLGKSAYAKLERGERGISFDEAIALSMIFDISLDSLRPTPSEVDSLSNDSEDPSVVHPIAVAEVITAAIRDERIERGWSMSELAKAARDGYSLPLHTTTIQRIENGERDLRMAEAFALAQILKIDLEKYIGPRNAKEE